MTSFNRTYRAPKFFLCTHTTPDKTIGFEKSEDRFTQFTYLAYGHGKFHFFYEDKIKTIDGMDIKKLYDLRQYINCNVVSETKMDSKIISFNSWRKNETWNGRLIDKDEKIILTNNTYTCVVCFEGETIINGHKLKELDFADLLMNKKYEIEILDNSYVALFELVDV